MCMEWDYSKYFEKNAYTLFHIGWNSGIYTLFYFLYYYYIVTYIFSENFLLIYFLDNNYLFEPD